MAVSEARAVEGGEAVSGGVPATQMGTRRWWLRAGIGLLAALYMLAWGMAGLLNLNPTDLDVFFLPSARIALAGHPLQVYSLRYQSLYPDANGPLSLVPLTVVAWIAQHLGWLNDAHLRRMLVMAAFAPFSLMMAWEGVAAVDRLRGEALQGVWRLLGYLVFAGAPTLWHGTLLYGHIELPLAMWLLLLGARLAAEDKPGRAGVSLGLAILARSAMVVYPMALLVLLLARRRWRPGAWLACGSGATVALGLLPFYLADRSDLIFSLVTFRSALPVAGGSLWEAVVGTPYEAFAQRWDSAFVLGFAVLISAAVVLARRDLQPAGRDVYGLLGLASIAFPLFIKTTWPYYFVDGYVLLAVWWLGEPGPWHGTVRRWLGVVLPSIFVLCAIITENGTDYIAGDPGRQPFSYSVAVLLLGVALAFGGWLICGPARLTRPAAALSRDARPRAIPTRGEPSGPVRSERG